MGKTSGEIVGTVLANVVGACGAILIVVLTAKLIWWIWTL